MRFSARLQSQLAVASLLALARTTGLAQKRVNTVPGQSFVTWWGGVGPANKTGGLRHRSRSRYEPHQGAREMLRRRIGGFAAARRWGMTPEALDRMQRGWQ